MKTLRETGYSILNAVNGFVTSDDQRVDIEWIYDKIWDVYAKLKNKYREKEGHLTPADYAQKCCLEIKCREEVCDGKKSGQKQYYVELPDIDWFGAEDPIVFFGSDNLETPATYKSINGFQNSSDETYISGKFMYTIVGSEAWVKNLPTSSMTRICMITVLEEPGSKCSPDEKFPAPRAFLFELELLVKRDILSTWGINPDLINNANDLPQAQRAPVKPQPSEEE